MISSKIPRDGEYVIKVIFGSTVVADQRTLSLKANMTGTTPETLLSKDSQSIFNLLGGLKQLPHIPAYVMKIEQLIDDETTTSADIARAIKQTPIFAAKILNTVNSSAFAKYEKIEGLEHAISYIGRNYIKDYILVAILNTFSFKTKDFNPRIFLGTSFLDRSPG